MVLLNYTEIIKSCCRCVFDNYIQRIIAKVYDIT